MGKIQTIIEDFMGSGVNRIEPASGPEAAWEMPLLGVAAGDDLIWESYAGAVIGPFHLTPLRAFNSAFPGQTVSAGELRVLSWVLPQTRATKSEQARQTDMTGERWARSRIMGEERVNQGLMRYLPAKLAELGIAAVAPELLPQFKVVRAAEGNFCASSWSERHAAHAAGLGTFGLCDGLITKVGKAHRLGSIVLKAPLPVSARSYGRFDEYCPFRSTGRCGACIKRCPAGALSARGHDKLACYEFLYGKTQPYVRANWHFDGYGCGLCQVGVPCESRIPGA
jgi:ferredoxin